MKPIKKKLFSALCALTACSVLAVNAGAAPTRERVSGNKIQIYGNLSSGSCNWDQLKGLLGQNGENRDLKPFIEEIYKNSGSLPLPPYCERPECPEQPEIPDVPIVPDEPIQPDQPDISDNESSEDDRSRFAQEILRLVNQERANAGLEQLKMNDGAQKAAQVRAKEQERKFSHTRPDGSSCFTALSDAGVSYQYAGENIAYGQKSPTEVMKGWMNSSGHRANILSKDFTQIGVGVYEGGNGTYYWTQMFIG